MNHILEFILKNWIWCAALVVIVVWLIIEETRSTVRGVRKISAHDATRLMNRENAVVIDVRDASAYAAGHILGATQVLPADFVTRIPKLIKQKEQPVILVCNMGQQSIAAGAKLRQQGFGRVYSLTGGINAWRQAGLPVSKPAKQESAKSLKKSEGKTHGKS